VRGDKIGFRLAANSPRAISIPFYLRTPIRSITHRIQTQQLVLERNIPTTVILNLCKDKKLESNNPARISNAPHLEL
jgi:hypothetical protein